MDYIQISSPSPFLSFSCSRSPPRLSPSIQVSHLLPFILHSLQTSLIFENLMSFEAHQTDVFSRLTLRMVCVLLQLSPCCVFVEGRSSEAKWASRSGVRCQHTYSCDCCPRFSCWVPNSLRPCCSCPLPFWCNLWQNITVRVQGCVFNGYKWLSNIALSSTLLFCSVLHFHTCLWSLASWWLHETRCEYWFNLTLPLF